ncbi:MAG: ABC transporter permease [Actinobacteria bacterium]|nr:ABC transporter permease [Actinomycetota bacterium]
MISRSITEEYANKHGKIYWFLHDSIVIAGRNLLRFRRNPEVLFFDVVQPIIFILLFAYVFGGAIDVGDNSYRSFLIPGIFVQTIAFAGASAAIGLNADMNSGIIDRFKSLPMNTTGVLLGQNFAELARSVITLLIMSLTGLAIGWEINGGFLNAIFAYLLLLAFGFSMSWIGASIGLSVSSPQVASTAGFAWLFPLTFLSNAFVPTENLPTWLRIFAEWNPITSIVASCRYLFGYPMEVAVDAPFSLQHPIITTIIWLVVITAIFMPIAGKKFRKVTSR